MEVVLLVGLVVQLITLVLLFTLMSKSKKQQAESDTLQQKALDDLNTRVNDQLENVVAEIKDHFEISLNQLSRDADEMHATLNDLADSSHKALSLQELAFSEATTGNSRIQDMLSDNSRRQQKLTQDLIASTEQTYRDTTAGVEANIRTVLEQNNKSLMTLSEASQRLLSSVSAHFSSLGADTGALKKAAAALLNYNKGYDEQLRQQLQTALLPLQERLDSYSEQQQESLQEGQVLWQQILQNTAAIEPVAEAVYTQQRHLQAIRDNTGGLVDASVSMQNHTERLQQVLDQGEQLQNRLQYLAGQQLTRDHYEEHQRRMSESLDDLAAVLQPLLGPMDDLSNGYGQLDQQALAALLDSSSASLMEALSDRYKVLLEQGQQLASSLDAAQTTLYTELDSVRAAQVKANQQSQDLQRLLGLLRLQQTSLLSSATQVAAAVEDDNGLMRIETASQIRYLSGSQIERIEDKISGECTRFFYNAGRKASAETWQNDQLKYRMVFNEQGGPDSASEFDLNGREVVQYQYDPAGNITSKRELHYDVSGMPTGSTETATI
jgi:hypothetical protein